MSRLLKIAVSVAMCWTGACHAQASALPAPIRLSVDVSDLDHRIVRVSEHLPVAPGPLKLLFPQWVPGHHGPTGDVTLMAGLQIRAGGKALAWTRDPVETESFHLQVPAGVTELEISFQHLSPIAGKGGRVTMSRHIVNLQWHNLMLYPAGYALADLRAQPSLTLPAGFVAAASLRPSRAAQGATQDYAEVTLESLIDSPVFAGRYYRRVELDPPGAARPATLHLFAEEPDQLKASDAQIEAQRGLIRQADKLFGSRHYRHYDQLLLQSSQVGGVGLEHHESSENGVFPGYFKDWDKGIRARQLLPHEYTHSWNGKFRRPQELSTPHLNTPMRTELLWVYEGQTEYWGRVLATRAGLVTPEQARDQIARTAAYRQALPGRNWRSLQDTTADPILDAHGERAWADMQRSWDYYDESTLVWLDVDSLIRERSGGKRSLDDFAHAFFGVQDGRVGVLTYTFDDVVAALNKVQPYDWAGMLRARLDHVGEGGHFLDGIERAGWKLEFDETESEFARNADDIEDGPQQDLQWSLGLVIGKAGKIVSVNWDGPAFKAGLAPGMSLLAQQGTEYSPERLAALITDAKSAPVGKGDIELLLKDGPRYWTAHIDYRGGLRYPKLTRVDGVPDRLSAILAPK